MIVGAGNDSRMFLTSWVTTPTRNRNRSLGEWAKQHDTLTLLGLCDCKMRQAVWKTRPVIAVNETRRHSSCAPCTKSVVFSVSSYWFSEYFLSVHFNTPMIGEYLFMSTSRLSLCLSLMPYLCVARVPIDLTEVHMKSSCGETSLANAEQSPVTMMRINEFCFDSLPLIVVFLGLRVLYLNHMARHSKVFLLCHLSSVVRLRTPDSRCVSHLKSAPWRLLGKSRGHIAREDPLHLVKIITWTFSALVRSCCPPVGCWTN